MVIYTVLAKKIEKINKKIEKKKIKNLRNNFWGPCQVLNIYISYKTARVVGLTPSLKSQGRGLRNPRNSTV